MPYVILHASRAYAPFSQAEAEGLDVIAAWARQVDESDLVHTGDYQREELPTWWTEQQVGRSGRELAEEIVLRTLTGYRRAVDRAGPQGQVAVAFGHGETDRWSAWVDLAPSGAMRVNLPMLERLGTVVLDRQTLDLSYAERAFLALRDIVRGEGPRPRVRRIDLLTCSVGTEAGGQRLLDWLHVLWGVPVRGVRGVVVFDAPYRAGFVPPGSASATVLAPARTSARQRASGYRVPFYHSGLPDQLWQSSRGRRPNRVGATSHD